MRRHIVLPAPTPGEDSFELLQNALNGGDLLLELPQGLFLVSKTLRVFSPLFRPFCYAVSGF